VGPSKKPQRMRSHHIAGACKGAQAWEQGSNIPSSQPIFRRCASSSTNGEIQIITLDKSGRLRVGGAMYRLVQSLMRFSNSNRYVTLPLGR
jgi:hypothetical protein